jgi:DNA-binding HxlR family transcriptional regulator
MKKLASTNSQNLTEMKAKCPLLHAMEQLNGRWKILLLWYIHLGLNRFGLIKKELPTLTSKMLSQQIKEMEKDGLVIRTIFPEMPPRVEYSLTPKAQTLIPILKSLNTWGTEDKISANIK